MNNKNSKFKVIARIKGGLGNQLFCYAAARRLALVNDAELVIDDVTGFVRDQQYRRQYVLDRFQVKARKATSSERMEPFERYRRAIVKLIARGRPFSQRRYIEQEGLNFDPRLLECQVNSSVFIDGYWQSEAYFKDVAQTIREDLKIIPPEDLVNQGLAAQIRQHNSVAVHVRWFALPTSDCQSLDKAILYYRHALDAIRMRVDNPVFYLFSDNISAAQQLLGLADGPVTCISHNTGDDNAFADLWLMSHCKHFIIADSTFSWWGAWLAANDNKIVICPATKLSEQTHVSAWGFDGLIPDGWIQLT